MSNEGEDARLIHGATVRPSLPLARAWRPGGMFAVAGAGRRGKLAGENRLQIGVRLPIPHEMTRIRTLGDGVEEWSCTRCSRRLLFRRPPEFEKVVLEPGDEWAAHVGATGGLQVTVAEPGPPATGELPAQDRDWLAEHGIDWNPGGAR